MRGDIKVKLMLIDGKFCVESDFCGLVCAFLRAFSLEHITLIKVGVFRCLIFAEKHLAEAGIPFIMTFQMNVTVN